MQLVQVFRAQAASSGYRAYVLTALVVVYAFNFIDRQIVGILAVPIKADLGLSDASLGLMGGLAFALFYTLLGIPIALLADRMSRIWIISMALALWSAMTAACGLAQNFGQLFLARLGVGVGEAGGVAPAYSLICDYYPPGQRARALAVYSFGIPIGSAVGIVAGGYLASLMSWRIAFFVVGLAGLIVTPLLAVSVREPARGGFDTPMPSTARPGVLAVVSALRHKSSFWWLSMGAASASMMGYGLFFWMPSFLTRSFGLDLLHASLGFGALLLVGGLAGIWFGGAIADRFGGLNRAAYGVVPAVAFVATVPFYVAGILATKLWVCMAILLVPTALGLAWLGPVLSAVQHIVPANMRATAAAIFLFNNNLIGLGLGTTLIGALSDGLRLRLGAESLRYAILAGTSCYLVATVCLLLASRRLASDWQR
jgi:predicted MFS family arabinose efflux permease